MVAIPNNLNEVDADWLNAALADAGHSFPAITKVTHRAIGEGVGMMSAMSILELEWAASEDSLPSSLAIKIAAENETNRGVAQQFKLYFKEVSYYRDLSPLTEARNPTVYAAELDDDDNFFLLMEDVSDYRMGSQVDGATLEETTLCIDFLVTLHSSFWGKLDQVDWLPHMSNSENARNMALGAEAGWPQLMDFFGEFVPENVNASKADYLANISRLQEGLDQPPHTLIHGDFRMDNMLFGENPDQAPLIVVDYQGPLKGNGIHDLAYLMSHSTKTEVRQAHERALVKHYADGMTAKGIDYPFDKAWQDYRWGVLYAWTVAVVIAGTMDPDNDRGYAWMSKMVKRNGTALNDLNCLELL